MAECWGTMVPPYPPVQWVSTSPGVRGLGRERLLPDRAGLVLGAHGGVPPGLLPSVAVPDLDQHGEGEAVQPAPGGCGALPTVCLYADSPVLGLGQKGHQPGSSHRH